MRCFAVAHSILTSGIGELARFEDDCIDVGDTEGGDQTGGEGNN